MRLLGRISEGETIEGSHHQMSTGLTRERSNALLEIGYFL
jgi:hypothetical protein